MNLDFKVIVKSFFITLLCLYILLILFSFPLYDIFHKRRLPLSFYVNETNIFGHLYSKVTSQHFKDYFIDLSRFKESYYYPYDVNSPYSVDTDFDITDVTLGEALDIYIKCFILRTNNEYSFNNVNKHRELVPITDRNISLLKMYTLKISDKERVIESFKQIGLEKTQAAYAEIKKNDIWNGVTLDLKSELSRPAVEGELPVNNDELRSYLNWIVIIEGVDTVENLKDAYGKSIKFEVIKDGLKATSAGPDKVFDTQDDEVFVNKL